MAKLFEESTSIPESTGTRGLWRAVLITPGVGSSGTWPVETIERDGPRVLRKGAKCFVTHNRSANGEPDPFSMWATLASDSWYEEGVGLVADIQALPSWIDKVEEVAPHTALSVYLMGESDEFGNITAILDDPQNGVDMVVYPGRPGSALVEKLYESAKLDSEKNNAAVNKAAVKETEGLLQMDQELKDRLAAIEASIEKIAGAKASEAQAEVDAEALAAAVDTAVEARMAKAKEGVAAIESAKADLLPSQVASLTESAMAGKDIAQAIEDSKKITAEAKALVAESAGANETGRLGEGATTHVLRGFASPKKGA